jgi:hypothetical protein
VSVDKHILQQWVAGAEIKFKKSRKPLSGIPLVNRIGRLAGATQDYVLTERIDLTRARDFQAQETSEDLLFASIDLPVFGKRGIGNDTGMAIASFKYKDQDGDEHNVIAICAYLIGGVVNRTRTLKQVITIPMV